MTIERKIKKLRCLSECTDENFNIDIDFLSWELNSNEGEICCRFKVIQVSIASNEARCFVHSGMEKSNADFIVESTKNVFNFYNEILAFKKFKQAWAEKFELKINVEPPRLSELSSLTFPLPHILEHFSLLIFSDVPKKKTLKQQNLKLVWNARVK